MIKKFHFLRIQPINTDEKWMKDNQNAVQHKSSLSTSKPKRIPSTDTTRNHMVPVGLTS